MYQQFAQYYDLIFPFRENTFQFLRSWLNKPPGAILDLGCGTGSYLARLAQEGYGVVGIDLNEAMLEKARQKCPQGKWLALNLIQLEKLNPLLAKEQIPGFDLIFCIGNVLSYLAPEELNGLLSQVFDLLRPGGHWIFQLVNWQNILKQNHFQFPVMENATHNIRFFRQYLELNPVGALFKTRLEKEGKTLFEEQQRLFAHTSRSIKVWHEQTSFEPVALFGDFKRSPFVEEQSGALIGVFKKGE